MTENCIINSAALLTVCLVLLKDLTVNPLTSIGK
jgi:hypothetical protein